MPNKGVDLIKEFEGCHLQAYPDPLSGNLPITIGWGSTKDLNGKPFKLGQKISQKVADDLLISQIKNEFIPTLSKIPYWSEMSDEKRGALLSFAYNFGINFYGSGNFSSITRHLREKNWDAIPKTLELYCNPGSKVEIGLLKRRKAEGELWKK
ncbi:lysozyme [bacterium]|nr:lysozyme [bacterium]